MTYFDAVLLGALQGLTEFLPISSSGHLVLGQALLGIKQSGITFEVVLHLGTLLAVFIYFRARILLLIRSLYDSSLKRERRIVGFLILGTVPAGIAGLLLNDFFEQAFSDPIMTSFMLLVTGGILLATRFFKKGKKPLGLAATVIMGIGQALAIMPGISRSGTTIASGMIFGVEPSEAAEFSFLLSIPAILGAVVLKAKELSHIDPALMGEYGAGLLSSFVLGLVAVYFVMSAIKRGKFDYFAYYCFAAGALGLYLFL